MWNLRGSENTFLDITYAFETIFINFVFLLVHTNYRCQCLALGVIFIIIVYLLYLNIYNFQ